MKFRDYASSKAVTLCFLGIGALGLLGLMRTADTATALILLTEGSLLLLTLGWLLCGYLLKKKRLKKLNEIKRRLPEPYLLGELLPRPADVVECFYFDVMKTISRSAISITEEARRDKEDYCDYVEQWIHEIKTPLTACSLILENSGDAGKLRQELKRADNLTETILYYARLRTAEQDMQFRGTEVAEVLDEAVKSQMAVLIGAGISVEITGGFFVHTDPKQLGFMIKQLLINCAKYCPRCHIAIHAANGVITVEDNGIGIPSHELERVTCRGFTGTNGRRLGGGTGMGLYLVNELCTRLGITFTVASAEGEYTRMTLSFDSLTNP